MSEILIGILTVVVGLLTWAGLYGSLDEKTDLELSTSRILMLLFPSLVFSATFFSFVIPYGLFFVTGNIPSWGSKGFFFRLCTFLGAFFVCASTLSWIGFIEED